ncbi:MAG: virulence protein RhuM/Fic/DOC family protein [Bacteroidetes bacterium]|nr:virulence protein RhuM/Fic/DOC family protein [Bacteroidota bacterium]
MSEIIIYQTKDAQTEITVQFDGDTVWLNQEQLAQLFERDRTVITKHLKNIFKERELEENRVCANFAHTTQHGAIKGKTQTKDTKYYNLDVIISVGYRVNSIRGTQFRQWATQRLKDYLVKGAAINQKRLEQLQQTIQLISQSAKAESLQINEAKGLLEIINSYTTSFVLLNQFDSNKLKVENLNEKITYEIEYSEAQKAIDELKKQLIQKKEATALFGNEKDKSFKSSLQSITQTFGGKYVYPSIEEQAAHLLYFVIKNHSFTDGNKRIGAFLFVWFLERNKYHLKKSGEIKINDTGLTTLALLVAQSNPSEKDIMISLIVNLIKNV